MTFELEDWEAKKLEHELAVAIRAVLTRHRASVRAARAKIENMTKQYHTGQQVVIAPGHGHLTGMMAVVTRVGKSKLGIQTVDGKKFTCGPAAITPKRKVK